jgi:hypothetical protein
MPTPRETHSVATLLPDPGALEGSVRRDNNVDGDAGMGWVLSMAVVEGLSAEEVAARLEAELGEETVDDSASGEEAGAGPGLLAVGVHGDGRAVILDDRYDDAPVLEDARLLARLSHATRVVLFQLSERVNCGFFQVGCWVDEAMAWQITHCREERETEEYQILGVPPGIFADKAASYRAQQAQADAAGEEEICYLGEPVVELFVSLTGIHYDRDGWWWDLRYRDLRPIDRASG